MNYKYIKQHDITDCGAACIANISKQHGLKIPITKIREVAGTDKQGTNALGLIKAAEQLGFVLLIQFCMYFVCYYLLVQT